MFPSLSALCSRAEPCCEAEAVKVHEVIHPEEPSFSEQLAPVAEHCSESTTVTPSRNSIRFNKMTRMQHMEIDEEFTRGIALHRALRHLELWTSPQEIRRKNQIEKVWKLSKNVSRFDTFLSHTWRTRGIWKVIALMMQSGWLHGLLAWSIALAIMLCLRGFDIISDPWKTITLAGGQPSLIPLTPWTIVASELALLMGVYLSPYVPCKTQMCFFDVACIHQGKSEMFKRGIYGIGGCLAVAEELRVLYTSRYLSSLWCVFEIVGFRKVKPEGKLTLSPLFIERSSLACAFFMFCAVLSNTFVMAYTEQHFRQRYIIVPFIILSLPTLIFAVHTLRFNYREKRRLMMDLETFNVDNVFCASDSDRDFILSAIEGWYGSRDAFNAFVQTDLRKELLGLLPSPHLPCTCAAMILSSQVASALDFCLSMQKAGFGSLILLRTGISILALSIPWFWFVFNAIFYLSDRSAQSPHNWLLDWCKTLAVAGLIFLFNLMGFAWWNQVFRSDGVIGLVGFVAFSLLLPFFILNIFPRCRRRETDGTKQLSKHNGSSCMAAGSR
eukprot:Skav218335  [mRNA]  locus=scaffold755:355540:357204:+ [translate_table: standard]